MPWKAAGPGAEALRGLLAARCAPGILPVVPRVQAMPAEWAPGYQVHALRDDDTGPLSNGGKRRKHASLLRSLVERGVSDAVVLGGRNSFNAAALVSLLAEHRITPWLVRHARGTSHDGTLMEAACELVVPPGRTVQVSGWDGSAPPWDPGFAAHSAAADGGDSGEPWPGASPQGEAAVRLASEIEARGDGRVAAVVPEGACCESAVVGAATLGADIATRLRELPSVGTVVMDAGTGLTAAAAVVAMAAVLRGRRCRVVVVDLAGAGPERFHDLAELCRSTLVRHFHGGPWANCFALSPPLDVTVVRPTVGRSFGSAPATLRHEMRRAAELAGIVVEPVYGAKLLHTAREHVLPGLGDGEGAMLVMSGGAQGLGGWAEWLRR